jgi:homoserine O-succinyltransferase/O-acetyltransferase
MPLVIDGGPVPAFWASKNSLLEAGSGNSHGTRSECVRIAFINNMPDPALEDTEQQFFELLDAAALDVPVSIKLYSLPGIPRGDRGQERLKNFYHGVDDLLNRQFDACIVTGTEPHHPSLREEPYWSTLVDVLEWAERNTVSTVLSCLAAHASVLHSDGIERHRLEDKQFGVFTSARAANHILTSRAGDVLRFPHSRWNEVQEGALASCGYVVLAKSAQAGVDSFVKKKRNSLFVHFQGHPEYGAGTLMKEYRRDIRRFLRRERETYPSMPHGYFDATATKLLTEFREKALSRSSEEVVMLFPESAIAGTLLNTWRATATRIYHNWLQYVVSQKADASVFAAMAAFSGQVQRKRTAMP